MRLGNILRGPLTSLLGFLVMAFCAYGWLWEDWLTAWEAGVTSIVGFALLFMKDDLPGLVKRLVDILMEKLKGK